MSVWTTKSFNIDRDYIVIKHSLPGINSVVAGVKFRNSFAVVEKDSKTYFTLKKISLIRNFEEYPLIFLKKLPFITRALDVKMVYGQDVYSKYIKIITAEKEAINKVNNELEEIEHLSETGKCKLRINDNKLCGNIRLPESPSGYCTVHLYDDPKLIELGVEVPKFIVKSERKEVREKIIKKLGKLKEEGKF